jgi:TolB-like protein
VRTAAQLIEINRFSDRHFWREDYDKATSDEITLDEVEKIQI